MTSGICQLCRWPSSVQVWMELVKWPVPSKPAHLTVTYIEWYIPDVILIQLILLMMSTGVLKTCRELEYIYMKKEMCIKLVIYKNHSHNLCNVIRDVFQAVLPRIIFPIFKFFASEPLLHWRPLVWHVYRSRTGEVVAVLNYVPSMWRNGVIAPPILKLDTRLGASGQSHASAALRLRKSRRFPLGFQNRCGQYWRW